MSDTDGAAQSARLHDEVGCCKNVASPYEVFVEPFSEVTNCCQGVAVNQIGAPRFRKKPVEIEAVQFNGSSSHMVDIQRWMNGESYIVGGIQTRDYRPMEIVTLEGTMTANPRDWVIKGVQGEFYPCKPDIFEATYEAL